MTGALTVLADIDRALTACLGQPIDSVEVADEIDRLITKHGQADLLRALLLSRAVELARHQPHEDEA